MSGDRTPEMFDQWARTYDDIISAYSDSFPFAGYNLLLDRIVELVNPYSGMKILDIGIGTGELAKRFIEYDCEIWGLDYSSKMLELARKKIPNAQLIKADVRSNWIDRIGVKFDLVVSAYTLHHFDLDEKVRIVQRLYEESLKRNGVIGIGDISFPTIEDLNKVRMKLANQWDDTEYYWSADLFRNALLEEKINLYYEQVSFCGGAYILTPLEST